MRKLFRYHSKMIKILNVVENEFNVINCICCGGVAQLVRALACHARGRGFKSRHSRHLVVAPVIRVE